MPRLLRSDHFGGRALLRAHVSSSEQLSRAQRHNPQFNQKPLPTKLRSAIGYLHLRKLRGPLIRLVFDHKLPRSSFESVQN
jgi:hypothetical protein